MSAKATVTEKPLKSNEQKVSPEAAERMAEKAVQALAEVSSEAHGTCSDERRRKGVLSGEAIVKPRKSVYGGPNVHALYISELTGEFGNSDISGKVRLKTVTKLINQSGIPSGGHEGCAANAKFGAVIGIIADQQSHISDAVAIELGDSFNTDAMEEVFHWAKQIVASGRYDDWHEGILQEVLGEEANEAIEILEGEHEGRFMIRHRGPGTIDQTSLHEIAGEDGFVYDDDYATSIERVFNESDDAHLETTQLHAREAVIAAITQALPNPELHQIIVTN